jgi:DNA-binding MarR family transcriptional regulator
MDEVRWLDEREQAAWRALQLMQMRLEATLARQLATDSGLSHADYAVLVALTDEPDGRLRLFELGRFLGWEKSRLSHHVTRMVNRGLVAKEPCDDDRRGAFVVITDQGRRTIEAAAPGHVEAVRRHFVDLLEPEELDQVAAIATKVLDALDDAPCD